MHANARSADSILTVAWIAPDFPLEWLADVPEAIQQLPRQHPATWQQVLLSEFENDQSLRIHVIVLRKNLQQNLSFTRNGVVFHVLATLGGLRAASLFWVDTIPNLRVVRRIQPDLVHAWGTERGAALIAARLGYPFLATIQGLLSWYAELVPLGPYNRFIAFLERISLRRSLRITTESRFAAEYLKAKYPRLAVQQVEHAPNWLFHRIERRPQIQPARLISVGTLGYRKGTDILLRAVDQLVKDLPFELVLVGAVNEGSIHKIKATVSPELWRRVVFKKSLLPAEVAKELASAAFLILPTRADTSPNAVKESVVAGVPVVASAIGGIPDYVFPEENGLLFPANDLAECTRAIRAACQHPLFGRGSV